MPTARSIKAALAPTKKESSYGTAILDAHLVELLKMTDIDFADVETKYRTDEDEITGYSGPTEHEVEAKEGSLARKHNSSVETIAAYVIWLLGRVTTAGTNPYTHTVKFPAICTLNPPSFSVIEGLDCAGSTGTFWLYKGMVVESLTIEVNGKSAVTLTINMKTDGSETAKASFTFPTSYAAVNRLLGSMLTIKCGPALEALTSVFRTLKITINAGIVEPPNVSAGVNVAEYQYGDKKPDLQIEFTIKGDKSHAVYGYYQANTTVKFQALLQKAAGASVQLDCEQAKVKVKQSRDGMEPRLSVTVMPEWNSTNDGPGVITIINAVAAYLTASV